VLRIALVVLLACTVLVAGLFVFGWWQFSRIERVNVASALYAGGGKGTNYLIVGSDSRQGIDPNSPNSGAFLGETVSGERTDTIMVLRIEGSKSYLLSIPRDLWVKNPATGQMGRINATYQSGPTALIQAVESLGIPVQHYMEINFVSFAKLVDAVGGITVDFPYPARDTHSGLDVPKAGATHLDGTQALAYVRSRYYEQLIDGTWQVDGTADLGRVQRQRAFLQALMGKVTGTKNPLSLMSVATAMSGGMRIDNKMTYFDALGLAWHLRGGFNPESVTLPVTPVTRGGAAVLDLQKNEAQPLVAQFSA
jgi:LCP family protein required for cell wall assembly